METLLVSPCSHGVHWSCYVSSVRAKTAQAGRCLICRKVCNWSNILIGRLVREFQGFMLPMIMEENWASATEDPPGEFLVASVCADLSEQLPLLEEVSMTQECFSALYSSHKIEVSPQGTWVVAKELFLDNRCGRGALAGLGLEAVAKVAPAAVKLPVASSLVSLSALDGSVVFDEFQLQEANAFQPAALFKLAGLENGARLVWRVPLPMQLFWNSDFHSKLDASGIHVSEDFLLDLLRHPEPEIFGRLPLGARKQAWLVDICPEELRPWAMARKDSWPKPSSRNRRARSCPSCRMGGRATATRTSVRTASRRAASRRAASQRAASRRATSRRAAKRRSASRRAAWTRAAPPCRSCWADGGINVRPAPRIRRMRTSRASSRTCSCRPASSATKASAPTTRGPSTFLRAPCRQRGAAFVCLASRKPRASWRSTRTLPRSVRQGCIRQQREERGTVLRQKALRDGRHATVEESWAQCLECEAGAISSCQVCGTKLCPAHIEQYPPDVSKVRRLWVCRHCRKYSAARAAAGKAVRDAAGLFFRRAVAAESSAAELIPAPLEEAEDCAACGLVFSKLPGSLRHHCRACGRSLCAGCLCGAQGCLVNAARCPHKARLYGKEERICKDCLPVANCRIEARGTCAKVYEAAARYAEHCLRVRAFLADPEAVPLYEANFVDTVQDKLLRAGGFAVEGAKRVAPFVSLPWSVGVRAVDVVWNYGQYGLLGILMREEIMQGIKTLLGFSSALQDIPPKDLLVGLLYLSAEQRKALRDAPEGNARLCRALGRPAPPKLLEALLGMALLGTFAPYQDTAFEVYNVRIPVQSRVPCQGARIRLSTNSVWSLRFLSHAHRTAALSIRGTDVEQSRGGDLFTDFDALGVGYGDDAAPSLLAHQGALQAAQALETELRPTLRALGQAGYRVILTGHSLGGAVAALLLWLLKHGTQGERLEGVEILGMGYATPAVVDLKTAEELRPHFTSLVNSMDAVPRLCRSALQRLAHELKDIASGSAQARTSSTTWTG
ncbi:unnamed protein product [Effrenium voratum]|nr:unnamed protein product [Effrenium voratum]